MSVFMFRIRRYRVLLLFSAFTLALWYHFSPSDGSFSVTDEWLQPTHGRGKTKEDDRSEWSPPDPDDAMPPSKDNPHAVAPNDDLDTALTTHVPLSLLRPGSFAEAKSSSAKPAAPYPTKVYDDIQNAIPSIPSRPMRNHAAELERAKEQSPINPLLALQGEMEVGVQAENSPHWTKMPEHFPIPTESIIPLPTGNPKVLPKIQFNFKHGSESNIRRNERLVRQGAVKDAFKHAWEGYRKYAWGHDEVTPVSGAYKDPFAGWAATLVDALDTMAIMGLHAEFEEALTAVAKIDFTTTRRENIPVFETTIRYLGGLLGAYDVTGQKHKILVDKAVELAEILYNAFDTPNRMPMLYFEWQPDKLAQKRRSGSSSCMAELGSLSVEFTRLAQVTGDNKYFDAIQRITDNFDDFLRKTSLPGFWPQVLDSSGCRYEEEILTITTTEYVAATPEPVFANTFDSVDAAIKEKIAQGNTPASGGTRKLNNKVSEEDLVLNNVKTSTPAEAEEAIIREDHHLAERRKRDIAMELSGESSPSPRTIASKNAELADKLQSGLAEMEKMAKSNLVEQNGNAASSKKMNLVEDLDSETEAVPAAALKKQAPTKFRPVIKMQVESNLKCVPTPGFSMTGGENKYSYGGMADSTYEYLLKEHILLGGLKEQYGKMYISTYETGRDNLFFRPMTPKNSDILVSGEMRINPTNENGQPAKQHYGEGSHLTCFVGGMVGMGSKIFDRPDDLKLAIKLTEGCVWNYFSTATGIMPENFSMAKCPATGTCEWDLVKWYTAVSPPSPEAIQAARKHGAESARQLRHKRDVNYDGSDISDLEKKSSAHNALNHDAGWKKPDSPPGPVRAAAIDTEVAGNPTHVSNGVLLPPPPPSPQAPVAPLAPVVPVIPKMDEYELWLLNTAEQLKVTGLPEGYTRVSDSRYILRPEAIESVFYMYRITGDKTWQDKGWKMFLAIEKYTKTDIAHSAIYNVLEGEQSQKLDSMESFWLAETLKYFYLLFSEPDVISLDDYVLNTEAHPLLRPKPKF